MCNWPQGISESGRRSQVMPWSWYLCWAFVPGFKFRTWDSHQQYLKYDIIIPLFISLSSYGCWKALFYDFDWLKIGFAWLNYEIWGSYWELGFEDSELFSGILHEDVISRFRSELRHTLRDRPSEELKTANPSDIIPREMAEPFSSELNWVLESTVQTE